MADSTIPQKLTNMLNEAEQSKLIYKWITDLCNTELRYEALRELSTRRDYPDLGIMLWHTFGAVAALLQEITSSYATLLAKTLNWMESNRVCFAMTLLQTIAGHPETRIPFLRAEILMYLLPMLNSTVRTLPVEYVRLSVLGVIGDLVKTSCNEVIIFLLGPGGLMPPLFTFLELGSEMTKAITAYILRRILDHDIGLSYFTNNKSFCFHLIYTLAKVVHQLTLEPEPRILKSVIGIYKRLTNDKHAQMLLQEHLPEQLRNDYFCHEYTVGFEEVQEELRDLNRRISVATVNVPKFEDSTTGQDGDCSSSSSGASAFSV